MCSNGNMATTQGQVAISKPGIHQKGQSRRRKHVCMYNIVYRMLRNIRNYIISKGCQLAATVVMTFNYKSTSQVYIEVVPSCHSAQWDTPSQHQVVAWNTLNHPNVKILVFKCHSANFLRQSRCCHSIT